MVGVSVCFSADTTVSGNSKMRKLSDCARTPTEIPMDNVRMIIFIFSQKEMVCELAKQKK